MKRIVAFGDSITAGSALKEGQVNWTDILESILECEVIAKGVGGRTSTQAIKDWNNEVSQLSPDIVIIEFGMNDHVINDSSSTPAVSEYQFEKNITYMIEQAKSINAVPVLVTPNRVIGEYYYTRHPAEWYPKGVEFQIKKYCDILKSIAAKNNVIIADIFKETENQNLRTLLRTPENGNFEDGVHPYGEGIPFYANCIAKACFLAIKLKEKEGNDY